MSLTASIDPTENAFTRNPVYLSVETTSMVTYNIMHCLNFEYRRSLFTGNGNGSFKVNIAEVLETVFEDIPVLSGSSDILINLSSGWYNKATICLLYTSDAADE